MFRPIWSWMHRCIVRLIGSTCVFETKSHGNIAICIVRRDEQDRQLVGLSHPDLVIPEIQI
jgi:hypothetical protein